MALAASRTLLALGVPRSAAAAAAAAAAAVRARSHAAALHHHHHHLKQHGGRRSYHTSEPTPGLGFLPSDEQRAFIEAARSFAREVIAPAAQHHDKTGEFPMEVLQKLHDQGLMNMHIPEEYGGLGLGALDGCFIEEELAWGCTGIQTPPAANTLAQTPVILAGSDEQKKRFLSPMIEKLQFAAYGVTEPGAGSDVAALKTRAVQRPSGEWVLNGQKMWITNAGHASWFYILARTDADAPAGRAFTAFIVEADRPGLVMGRKEWNMGQRCSDTRGFVLEDVVVPDANRVGPPGAGFKISMQAFDFTRPPVAAAAVGVARRCRDEAVKYALERKTMGVPIIQHQQVSAMIADMTAGIEAAQLLYWKACWQADHGIKNTLAASSAKLFAGDLVNKCASDAVQILGGYGYNSEFPVEKLMRDAKIFQIYEGTAQIQRLIIAREAVSLVQNQGV